MNITDRTYYFNTEENTPVALEANSLAVKHGFTMSRWVNNSKKNQTVTYIIHTGDRAAQARHQKNVAFKTQETADYKWVYDETTMLRAIIEFLTELETATEIESDETDTYMNTDERYGNQYTVNINDYLEFNPAGEFEIRYDGIYELVEMRCSSQWMQIAEVV